MPQEREDKGGRERDRGRLRHEETDGKEIVGVWGIEMVKKKGAGSGLCVAFCWRDLRVVNTGTSAEALDLPWAVVVVS